MYQQNICQSRNPLLHKGDEIFKNQLVQFVSILINLEKFIAYIILDPNEISQTCRWDFKYMQVLHFAHMLGLYVNKILCVCSFYVNVNDILKHCPFKSLRIALAMWAQLILLMYLDSGNFSPLFSFIIYSCNKFII